MWWHAYVGLPFEDGGRGPESFDCWGIVRDVFARELGIDLPSYGEISARDLARLARAFEAGAAQEDVWAPVDVPQAFDVVPMRRARAVIHVGVMIDSKRLLHTEEATGAVVVPIRHMSVAGRIAGFRRYRA